MAFYGCVRSQDITSLSTSTLPSLSKSCFHSLVVDKKITVSVFMLKPTFVFLKKLSKNLCLLTGML